MARVDFCGAGLERGSTLIARETTGRQARLIELDPRYCDVIIRRWQEFSGGGAVLDGDGRRFEEISAHRCAAKEGLTVA
jgi:hypothetical protein